MKLIKIFTSSPSIMQFYITEYFNNEPRFNGVYSKDNLPRIKDETFFINLNDKQSKGTHWISLFIHKNTVTYFDSFGIKYIPQDVLSKIKHKSINHNVLRRHFIFI